jgi:hypothetical protein
MTDVDALAGKLRQSFGRERGGEGADFTYAIWKRLRAGDALPRLAALKLAAELGLANDEAETLLARSAELDADGDVVGFSGLSLKAHAHQIEFGDRTLSAWCAWDPFFLVPALGGVARVISHDPLSGTLIELRFEDGLVVESSLEAPVISIVVPEESDDGVSCGDSVDAMLATFCSQVHLFENEEHLERYFASRGVKAVALNLDEAQALGRERVHAEGNVRCHC